MANSSSFDTTFGFSQGRTYAVYSHCFELEVAASPEEVWQYHGSAQALVELTPTNVRVKVLGPNSQVEEDALHRFRLWLFGLVPITWEARISQVTPPFGFTDEAERSPFRIWRHRHDFIPNGTGTLIRDRIGLVMPRGKIGKVLYKLIVKKKIEASFAHRHEVYRSRFGG
jgi:ligand-binding SRPBCC domain-containing protein